MTSIRHSGGWVIVATLFFALVLTVLPLPPWGSALRPEWTALVLIYWCLVLPQRVGVGVAWLAGGAQDALQGSLLGAHAGAYALVAFVIVRLHRRIRAFPLWQQALLVLVMLLMVRVVLLWIRGLIGRPGEDWDYWLPAVMGALAWPVVFVLLREMRQRYGVR